MATLTIASGSAASAGDNTLVAAPGVGLRICPIQVMMQNATATADTMILYDGPSSDLRKLLPILGQNQGDGVMTPMTFPVDTGKVYQVKLTENKALVLNKAQAVATNYTVWYYTESTAA